MAKLVKIIGENEGNKLENEEQIYWKCKYMQNSKENKSFW